MRKLVSFLIIMVCIAQTAQASMVDLKALAMVESSGNPAAVGDKGRALGLFQAHAGCVSDVNRALGTKYSHRDVLDPEVAVVVASAYLEGVIPGYLKHYGIKDTLENRLTAYNMGIGAVVKGKKATKYISAYRRYANGN